MCSGRSALGGATGNGNVTQINILSYNIINPQLSLNGREPQHQHDYQQCGGRQWQQQRQPSCRWDWTLLGGAIGNGNTTQLAFFSGNIFNPQFSLFGRQHEQ